jgi:hypothetical protein
MGIIERRCEWLKQPRHLIVGKPHVALVEIAQVRSQRGSRQIFHHNIGMAIRRIEIEDLHDVVVTQTRDDSGFPLEARQQARIFLDKTMQDLYRNRPFQGQVGAQIHLCHSPACKEFLDPNFTDCLSNPFWHGEIIQHEPQTL